MRLSGGIPGGQAILQATPAPVLASLKSVGILEQKDALKATVALISAPEAPPVGILEAAKEGQSSVRKNPFVLQLSQGRSGSTLTGTMMLQHHPACLWYIDELLMVVQSPPLKCVATPINLTLVVGRPLPLDSATQNISLTVAEVVSCECMFCTQAHMLRDCRVLGIRSREETRLVSEMGLAGVSRQVS